MKLSCFRRILFTVLIGLTACVTPYAQFGMWGGYQSSKLEEDTYHVRFDGNDYTSTEIKWVFAYRRCAELTLEQGKRYFILDSRRNPDWVTHMKITSKTINRPSVNIIFTILDSKSDSPNAFDAVNVVQDSDKAANMRLSPKARECYNNLIRNNI